MTGQALNRVLKISLERATRKLLTVADPAEFRAIQREAHVYQDLIDLQTKPPITPVKEK